MSQCKRTMTNEKVKRSRASPNHSLPFLPVLVPISCASYIVSPLIRNWGVGGTRFVLRNVHIPWPWVEPHSTLLNGDNGDKIWEQLLVGVKHPKSVVIFITWLTAPPTLLDSLIPRHIVGLAKSI